MLTASEQLDYIVKRALGIPLHFNPLPGTPEYIAIDFLTPIGQAYLKAVECVRLGTESEIEQAIGEVEAACERVLEGNPSTDCRLDTFGLRLGKIAEYVLEKWAPGARSLYEINQELPACPQFEPGG